jgi:hypothetical protein
MLAARWVFEQMTSRAQFVEFMESPTGIQPGTFCTCGQVRDLFVLLLLCVQGGNLATAAVLGVIPERKPCARTTTCLSVMDANTGPCSANIRPPFVTPITLLPKSQSERR